MREIWCSNREIGRFDEKLGRLPGKPGELAGMLCIPGAPLTYFNDGGGGSKGFFLGLTFWPKGIFWGP